jgi:hypothetical protein
LRQQTRARRALLDWLRRLACRNSSVLRSLRGGNERNITKSLADRFWADDLFDGIGPICVYPSFICARHFLHSPLAPHDGRIVAAHPAAGRHFETGR